ncbi:GH92 family glycosyl hydrolase [Granulicella cerasi]|uniref:GH92 family glycosyl hydrolase n=1 Tax=Granulicella cerasi TaxID=741063 RepID=UPI0021E0E97D|nr:GH92 family glycosyl hydrolase [Granulicella cerasi]
METISRRRFLASSTAACAAATLPASIWAQGEQHDDPLRWVDLRIGTGGHGHTFPGATLPFGMVQLSPDTGTRGWDWCSGYHRSDSSIIGFSHTHLSGTGAADLLDFLVMPGTGRVVLSPGKREHPEEGYRSKFDRSTEQMEPGYYSVVLSKPNVRAEMTATERVGLHRYTFPASQEAWLIVDLSHVNGDSVRSATMVRKGEKGLRGGHQSFSWADARHSYFALELSKTPTNVEFFSEGKLVDSSQRTSGKDLKAVLHFHTEESEQIVVRVAISAVDEEGAEKNLRGEVGAWDAGELPGWDFDGVRAKARAAWAKQLSKIRVDTTNDDHKRVFYTAMYHMAMGPTLFDDVDGRYRGMDNKVHSLHHGQHNYTCFSLWDTFRAAHPMYVFLEPERVPEFCNTLVRMAHESPAGMPVWPLWGRETDCMTGYHSASVISEAIVKGVPGIDVKRAYAAMLKHAQTSNLHGLEYYRSKGYIPADKVDESVSRTFEYCYNDAAIAQVAERLGHTEDAAMLRNRATNYRRYFNKQSQFMQPVMADGSWATPFDPKGMGHFKQYRDFTESNSWQTTFGAQHDPAGLIKLFGSRQAFLAKLDELFNQSSELPPDAPPDIAGMVGQYAHGNEPSHHIAYLYVYGGEAHKTQERVRSLMETMYSPNPDGMAGNEDVGQMSAWFVMSSMGFYSVDPASGNFVVGSPLFDRAVMQLAGGKELVVEARRNGPKDVYVQSFALNDVPQKKLWFSYEDIKHGGKLSFVMGSQPNLQLGAAPEFAPPSLKA